MTDGLPTMTDAWHCSRGHIDDARHKGDRGSPLPGTVPARPLSVPDNTTLGEKPVATTGFSPSVAHQEPVPAGRAVPDADDRVALDTASSQAMAKPRIRS